MLIKIIIIVLIILIISDFIKIKLFIWNKIQKRNQTNNNSHSFFPHLRQHTIYLEQIKLI